MLDGISNINLIEPLEYDEFVFLMSISYLILTDSGASRKKLRLLASQFWLCENIRSDKKELRREAQN